MRLNRIVAAALCFAALPALAATTDVEYLRAGKYSEARTYLEHALKQDPDSAPLHCNLGIAQLRMRDYMPALDHLRRATSIDPYMTAAWLNLAACYVCMGEFDKAIESYRHAQTLTPLAAPSLEQLTAFLSSAKKVDETSSDYFHPSWRRWADGATIKLFVPEATQKSFRPIALYAMKDVIAATGGKLKLDIVQRKEDANVICQWVRLPSGSMVSERGVATGAAKNGKIISGSVQVFLNNESGLNFLSDDTVRKSCLHEFMHVLGVKDHSANVEDIMFALIELPTVEPRLSLRDKATLRRLYDSLHIP